MKIGPNLAPKTQELHLLSTPLASAAKNTLWNVKNHSTLTALALDVIALPAMVLGLVFDLAIATPVNLTFGNAAVILNNKKAVKENDNRKVVKTARFVAKHKLAIISSIATTVLLGLGIWKRETVISATKTSWNWSSTKAISGFNTAKAKIGSAYTYVKELAGKKPESK
jgi:hypothetical protein